KQIQNKQIRDKFEPIRRYTEATQSIRDGEIYNHNIPFSMISSCVMTQDHTTQDAIKKWNELCIKYEVNITREEAVAGMKFWCFDGIENDDFNKPFQQRYEDTGKWCSEFPELVKRVIHVVVNNPEEVQALFEQALEDGYEGLILRSLNGIYKFGRCSLSMDIIFKVKPFVTLDAQIIGVVQATIVNPNADKKTNELGRSVTSKKKEDRIPIESASAFVVMYEGEKCKPTLDMSVSEKNEIWKNKDSYIGRWIEYKGMLLGSLKVPRHPGFVRFREDKDE
ncbi:MAG: hypothetical protein M0R03_16365, partial [Novosphingobium sp.]|nr:hypothetical protein [Novosphingobium sp.]